MQVGGKKITIKHRNLADLDFATVHADGAWIGNVDPSDEGGWMGWAVGATAAPPKRLLEPGSSHKLLRKATARGMAKALAQHVLLGR
jgi:hypothetical protein